MSFTVTTSDPVFTFTIGNTAATSSTVTYVLEEHKPEPKKQPTYQEVIASLKQPDSLPPIRYGYCRSCNVTVAMDAFEGCCSVCGRTLRPC